MTVYRLKNVRKTFGGWDIEPSRRTVMDPVFGNRGSSGSLEDGSPQWGSGAKTPARDLGTVSQKLVMFCKLYYN